MLLLEKNLHQMPQKPRGKLGQVNCLVDSDHEEDRETRRSQTGIIYIVINHQYYGIPRVRIQLKVQFLGDNL